MTTLDIPRPARPRLPDWLRLPLPTSSAFTQTRNLLNDLHLHTVCESAKCPNHWECWSQGTATFMIAGDRCTRACGFCAVTTAKPFALEEDEPQRVAEGSALWTRAKSDIKPEEYTDFYRALAGQFDEPFPFVHGILLPHLL